MSWLHKALRQLNPDIPEEAREKLLCKVLHVATPSLAQTNRAFHRMLSDAMLPQPPSGELCIHQVRSVGGAATEPAG